jgi:hypothetical protein
VIANHGPVVIRPRLRHVRKTDADDKTDHSNDAHGRL